MRKWLYLFTLLILAPLTSGSDCSTSGDPLMEPAKLLYVLDQDNDAVYVLEGAETADGTVAPTRTITGENTRIVNPRAIAADSRRDILYVADASEEGILVYAPASEKDGDVNPTRFIPAAGNIQHMYLDEINNRLYVYNATELSIQVWDDVSTVNGDFPDRFFILDFLASAIFVDIERDILYAADTIGMEILAYSEASTLIGSPLPTRTISYDLPPFDPDARPLDRINGLTMNFAVDILFITNGLVPAIDIFLQASTVNGEMLPDRFLEGDNTALTSNVGALRFRNDVLYVRIDDTQIAAYDEANNLNGDIAPSRTLTVDGASNIRDFAIDLAH